MKHTPGQVEYGIAKNYTGYYIAPKGTLPTLAAVEQLDGVKLRISCFNFPGKTEANARFIVTAWNSHYELLEALQEYVDNYDGRVEDYSREYEWVKRFKQAIAKTKEV